MDQEITLLTPELDLSPLDVIRTETEMSKYPVHNLAKTGKVNIVIRRLRANGQVDVRWEVSFSERHGQARQLAYKLDTLVINRRIDECGRPVPELIRLGSLRDICKDLGLSEGKAMDGVKKALHQNAGAYIQAKLKYRCTDGSDRSLEAGFTRYGVVFTGETLPNGHKANAVYLVLNKIYREVLNHAPVRPLDYSYLKSLKPAAQRFYEILSRSIFAALNRGNDQARILYSDYCLYSAQKHHFDYENFRVQMAKIHREHLRAGYLAKVDYEARLDDQGRPDWLMTYTPGPRAKAQFTAFSAKRHRALEAAGAILAPKPEEKGDRVAPASSPMEPQADPELVAALVARGVTEPQAQKALRHVEVGQPVLDQLEYGDHVIAQNRAQFRNPPGFYVSLIRNNVIPPLTFETSQRRKEREVQERTRQEKLVEEKALRTEYDHMYRLETRERYVQEHLPREEYQALLDSSLKECKKLFPRVPAQTLQEIAHSKLCAEIEPRVTFLTFEEWKSQRSSS